MPELTPWLVSTLLRTTMTLLIAAVVTRLFLRGLRIQSPSLHRYACLLVLMQGWIVAPWTLAVPWYDSPPITARNMAVTPSEVSHRSRLDWERDLSLDGGGHVFGLIGSTSTDAQRQNIRGLTLTFTSQRMLLVGIWIAGVLVVIGMAGLNYVRFVRCCRDACDADPAWLVQWQQLLREHGVRRHIPLQVTGKIGPILCRLPGGYRLFVPRRFWAECGDDERLAILRHELSHYRRGDIEKTWLVYLLALPHWFNPAAWWVVRTFRQAGEWLCDADAAQTPAARVEYLHALGRLVQMQCPATTLAGHCAHAHPLLSRVRRLLNGSTCEDSQMKRLLFVGMALALAFSQWLRVELVAREPDAAGDGTVTVASLKAKMDELDQRLESIEAAEEPLRKHAEKLKSSVDEKVSQLKKLREDSAALSDEVKRRAALFMSGEEVKQIEALKDITQHSNADETVLMCGYAVRESPHESVRRAGIVAMTSLGKTGYPAMSLAFEALNTKDRVFLVEHTKDFDLDDRLVFLSLMAKEANGELLDALLSIEIVDERQLLFLGAVAEKSDGAYLGKLVEVGQRTAGDHGLLILYAVAKANQPKHTAAAVTAAVERGNMAFPIIAAAFKFEDAETRAAVVLAAKKLGGEAGEFVIERARADSNEGLRKAAEEALKSQ